MKPGLYGNAYSHGDLHNLEIIEDRCGARRKHGLPARYTKGRFLGKGGFAKCYEVQDMETKEVFAAKIVSKASIAKPRAHAKLRSEIAIHRSLDHERVVKFYDYFEDAENVYIILELCVNQTLNEFMRRRPNKRLSEAEAMFYIYDLVIALKYLHRRRVIHRDLKLGNLFLDGDMRMRVGDFGLAAQLEHDGERKRTICGTPNYIAPEILDGKHGHSYEVDIWSVGVILYTMVIGRPPFETSDVKTTYKRIRINQYGFPESVRISDPVKDLITSILRTDPRSRPSLDEILGSTWFQSAQRLPPPMPVTVSAFTVSPRVACGGSSARSETPERGAADFARIDSPVPRFPLRDRSPNAVPSQHAGAAPLPRGHSAAPVLLSSRSTPPAAPYGGGSLTPGRVPPSAHGGPSLGRPPLAHRGNEENLVPNAPGYTARSEPGCTAPLSPLSSRNHAVATGAAPTPCGSASHRSYTPCAVTPTPTGGPGVSPSPQTASFTPTPGHCASARGLLPHPLGRDASPLLSAGGGLTNMQPPPSRLPGYTPTQSRSPILGAGSGLTNMQPPPSRLPGYTPTQSRTPTTTDSPIPTATCQRMPATPGGSDTDLTAARPGSMAAVLAQATCDRRQLSARRNERCSSSPALLAEALQNEAVTPRKAARPRLVPDGSASDRKVADYEGYPPPATSRACPPSARRQAAPGTTTPGTAMPELWVTKWVDYSSKYGVGYILSDGSIGVYFNDSTKIIMVPDQSEFDYVTRRTTENPEQRTTHTFENYPEELKKKVTLLRHFKNYMLTDALDKKDGATAGESSLVPPARHHQEQLPPPLRVPGDSSQPPYVKKWTRNKHAIMFQLSNKIVQVVFFDKTEAVLSSRSHTVTYVDKKGQVCSYPLSNVLDVPSPELAKRLRYTKDILVHLLGVRAEPAASG